MMRFYFQNYIKARRFFVGDPVWTPIYRPAADEHPSRQQYIAAQKLMKHSIICEADQLL
jgi:cupin superfamily acireductone dioxygenase involved in methionine salvage